MKRISACVIVFICGTLLAAPPTVDIPANTKASGQYVIITPKTDAKGISYVGMSGVDPIPNILLQDKRVFVFDTYGKPEGTYKFKGIASLNDEHTPFDFTVTIGKNGNIDPLPPNPNPKPDPKPDPIPDGEKTSNAFVAVIEGGTRTIEIGKMLNDPYWSTIGPKHEYAFYLKTEQAAIERKYTQIADTVGYPAVIIMDKNTGKVLKKFKAESIDPIKSAIKEVTK